MIDAGQQNNSGPAVVNSTKSRCDAIAAVLPSCEDLWCSNSARAEAVDGMGESRKPKKTAARHAAGSAAPSVLSGAVPEVHHAPVYASSTAGAYTGAKKVVFGLKKK